ncbi:cell envelope integrity protein TolA [Maritalea myrionectae]|uniref:cell envelope integrity protein TolA n=1 Tax=Maritalea myrionectae TaxID=454601 RepID=UPI00041C2B41|nr:cell envelope integrity protein TolA [Maritalea myrionectae]
MRLGITISAVSHAALIAVGLMSFGQADAFDPQEIEAIPIELVPIEEFSNIRQGSLDSNVIETETPSAVDTDTPAELAEPTGNTQEDQVTPKDTPDPSPAPTDNSAPEPTPPTPPAPEPTPEPVEPEPQPEQVEPSAPAPVEEPTPEPVEEPTEQPVVTEEPAPEPTPVPPSPPAATSAVEKARQVFAAQEAERQKQAAAERAQQEKQSEEADKISDIINKEESRGGTTGQGGQKTAGKTSGTAARLTQSERAALAAQMRKCWNPPISALDEDGLTVRLLVDLNRDGSVAGTPQVMDISISGQVGQATASAAQRAVRRCGPYQLAAEKYEEWRQVDVTFDPRDLR